LTRPTTANYGLKKSLPSDPERTSGLAETWGPVKDANYDAIDAAIAAAATGAVGATQTPNTVMAGPATGPAATAAFRVLVAADIPALPESAVTNLSTDLAAKVPTTRTVNGKALSGNISLAASDLGAASAAVPINTQTTDYTLALSDEGALVRMNKATANTLTVPTNASVAFPIGTSVAVRQVGAGVTTLAAAGGVTINNPGTDLNMAKQFATALLVKVGTDEWDLIGGVTGTGGGAGVEIDWVRSSTGGYNGASSSITQTLDNDVGDVGILSIWWTGDNTTTVSSITDTAGNSWTLLSGTKAGPVASSNYTYINHQLAICTSLKSGTGNTVTVHFSATNASYCGFTIHEFSGLIGTVDQVSEATGTTSPVTGGTVTTTVANELIFVSFWLDNGSHGPNTVLPGSTYELLDEGPAGSADWNAQWQQLIAAGSISGAFGASSNVSSYAASMVTVK
jgi:hypothetical protein